MADVHIGTSGYSFQDWKGRFYPSSITDGEMLLHYAKHFSCAEVNSTYYRIPHPKVFHHMVQKVPKDFEFIIKVHSDVTHKREKTGSSLASLALSIQPIVDENMFSGYLAQFPYSFKNRQPNRQYLARLSQLTDPQPLFVEFRHASWATPPLYDFLSEHRLNYVNVDEPALPNLLLPQVITTSDTGYVRFHGRNADTWWDKNKGDRYDYFYSQEELAGWQEDIQGVLNRVKNMYLFFNNCHHGHAAQNALDMKALFYI
ncbi:MAG: DUF72 domain-containing protein [Candidatus Marinimicrobia bacterium]|jgi:uncharacterized protein YecE (DUF72 family)|nr:DUF72 domain-containing protein [Candidatus Neomarinimicrobiota bacterium]MDP6593875.1 DUF72 domain-containing protein [Candidatus Neomarinimicrobiota bacterium]MDP6835888.1 DUF72 domain-containing protein [Candidatus Neomarinimicrobiota bacterium]MDP6966428.1 DUF72 domain-containing protein [Candidatus Neomarinimicrobiota bacterium]|tara:strand:- start:3614 stop:4387 length:774 start_codon:yes stop_codon:yes gene_type:complete